MAEIPALPATEASAGRETSGVRAFPNHMNSRDQKNCAKQNKVNQPKRSPSLF
jgi:hypothetical protein